MVVQRAPTHFMCLILKLLQLQPDKEIIVEFIKNEDYKYVRVLGEARPCCLICKLGLIMIELFTSRIGHSWHGAQLPPMASKLTCWAVAGLPSRLSRPAHLA